MNANGDTPTRPTRFAATVLFVDMVDSTRRAVELGDSEWVDLQTEHDAMLRRIVRRFGGRRLQTLGDGLVAIFATASPGVRCGTAIAASWASRSAPDFMPAIASSAAFASAGSSFTSRHASSPAPARARCSSRAR
jgi:class 3 adenylate cyclase